eukprot:m.157866 g.157866  ORF g.157866 m.157866 type:complete len:117 (-) comp13350_c0_seq22:82-432(-)
MSPLAEPPIVGREDGGSSDANVLVGRKFTMGRNEISIGELDCGISATNHEKWVSFFKSLPTTVSPETKLGPHSRKKGQTNSNTNSRTKEEDEEDEGEVEAVDIMTIFQQPKITKNN